MSLWCYVGIVSEEVKSENMSYIAASYVKFIESAGGRVVPILYPPPTSRHNLSLYIVYT